MDGTRVFINQYSSNRNFDRPRITTAQMADILERARAKAEELAAEGVGDFTKERHEGPQLSFEEVSEKIKKNEAARLARCSA